MHRVARPGRFPVLLLALAMASVAGAAIPPAPHPATTNGPATWTMRGDFLVIEAEAGTGGWESLAEAGERVIRSKVGEQVAYRVKFDRAGVYFVHLRCRLTVGHQDADGRVLAPASTNDAGLTVGGAKLYGADGRTRPDGMRCHSRVLQWSFLPKGPGAHTPEAIRDQPVFTYIPQPGVYDLVISYRSPAFVLDKIAFTVAPQPPPEPAAKEAR